MQPLFGLLVLLSRTLASPFEPALDLREPVGYDEGDRDSQSSTSGRKLHGRFLHVTDFHPDPYYKVHSSTEHDVSCHRGTGSAGLYGTENTECDSPYSLVNETFRWIEANLKDSIDFIVWTGDSARHDNDEELPRTEEQILEQNEFLVEKFVEVFGKDDNLHDTDPTNDMLIPIIPNFGNNDVLPHNVFPPGPNRWTRWYAQIWRRFIPEEQRHAFERGGWFYVEVIPNRLAVFSLNTLYFFDSNPEADGCASRFDPGNEQLEWLRVQLQFLRERGMKAILTGHVPPARTDTKSSWDESCWQLYTLWLRQFRDVVVGSVYGHMNIDHFMFQDSHDIDVLGLIGKSSRTRRQQMTINDDLSIKATADYLIDLREEWSKLPELPKSWSQADQGKGKQRLGKAERYRHERVLRRVGGPWAERYIMSHVSPSVIPNYYPTLRVVEYNTTGLKDVNPEVPFGSAMARPVSMNEQRGDTDIDHLWRSQSSLMETTDGRSSQHINSRRKHPHLIIPDPPSKSSPPGPAYSPQTLTWLGLTQYFANLTYLNGVVGDEVTRQSESEGHKNFSYEVEYSTFDDGIYKLRDMTVRSYLGLARRIGQFKPQDDDRLDSVSWTDSDVDTGEDSVQSRSLDVDQEELNSDPITNKKHKKHKKHRKHRGRKQQRIINKVWFTFVKRAFVGAKDDEDIYDVYGTSTNDYGEVVDNTAATEEL